MSRQQYNNPNMYTNEYSNMNNQRSFSNLSNPFRNDDNNYKMTPSNRSSQAQSIENSPKGNFPIPDQAFNPFLPRNNQLDNRPTRLEGDNNTNTNNKPKGMGMDKEDIIRMQTQEISRLKDQINSFQKNDELIFRLKTENDQLSQILNARLAEIKSLKDNFQPNIIEKPVYIEKVIEKVVEVPVEKIVEKPVEKIVEKIVTDEKIKNDLNQLRNTLKRYLDMEKDFMKLIEKTKQSKNSNEALQKEYAILLEKFKYSQVEKERFMGIEKELGIVQEKLRQAQEEKNKFLYIEQEIQNLNDRLRTVQLERDRYEKDYNQVLFERDRHEKDYNQLLIEKEKGDKNYKQLLAERDKFDRENHQLLFEKEKYEKEYNQVLYERDRYEKDYNQVLVEKDRYEKDYNKLLLEKDAYEKGYNKSSFEKERYEKDYTKLLADKEKYEKEYNKILIERDRYEKDYKQSLTDKEKIDKENNKLLVERERFEKDINQLTVDKQKLENDCIRIGFEKEHLQNELKATLVEKEKLEKILKKLQEKAALLENDKSESDNKLSIKIIQLETERDDLLKKLSEKENENQQHKREKEVLKCSALHSHEKDNLLAELLAKVQDFDKIIDVMEKDIYDKKACILARDNEIERLNKQVEKCGTTLEEGLKIEVENQIKKFKEDTMLLAVQLQAAQLDKRNLEQQIQNNNTKLNENEVRIRELENKLRENEKIIENSNPILRNYQNLIIENQRLNFELVNLRNGIMPQDEPGPGFYGNNRNPNINPNNAYQKHQSPQQQQPFIQGRKPMNNDQEPMHKQGQGRSPFMNKQPEMINPQYDRQTQQQFDQPKAMNRKSSISGPFSQGELRTPLYNQFNYNSQGPNDEGNNGEYSDYNPYEQQYSKQSNMKINKRNEEPPLKSAGMATPDDKEENNANLKAQINDLKNQVKKLKLDYNKLKNENIELSEKCKALDSQKEYPKNDTSQSQDSEAKIPELQRINEELLGKLYEKEKYITEELEKVKKLENMRLSEMTPEEREKYDIRELQRAIAEMKKDLDGVFAENIRLNDLAKQRTLEIEALKLKYDNAPKNDNSDKRNDNDSLKKQKADMADIKFEHEKEINAYKLKIQQLVHLIDSKEEEIKALHNMNKKRKEEMSVIQEQLDKLKEMELELQLTKEKYEQLCKENKTIIQGRDYYATEFTRVMKLYNELLSKVGTKNDMPDAGGRKTKK